MKTISEAPAQTQRSILIGDKIALEPFSENHLTENYVRWLNDPEVCRYNSHGAERYTLAKAKDYFREIQQSKNKLVFAICLLPERRHVGNVSLYISTANNSGEIAILIGEKDVWGKGIGTEAYQILIDYAFHHFKLHRLFSGLAAENVPMKNIVAKLGFEKEGVLRDAFLKNGKYQDIEYWGLLNRSDKRRTLSVELIKSRRKAADYGKPLYDKKLQYCVRCCMPETNEGIKFDEMGICQACQSQEQKIHINWTEREQQLRKILESYKSKAGDNYDCIVPISGGKDSAFQLHVLVKRYGIKPLAVTFNHNWYSETGKYNLWNILEKLNVDHIMFTPNRALINKLAKQSLYKIGDSCWHCHAGVGAFPLHVAAKFKIPLLVWGESVAESSGRACYYEPVRFDSNYFLHNSAKVTPTGMTNDVITSKDVFPFQNPAAEEMEKVGVTGIHLGDYIFWDDERQMEFIRKEYGWREDLVEGTYKGYKSVECIMPGVHDYTKFLKRGFGRATDHASQDVRSGLLSREEGFELAKNFDAERPQALDYYLKITGLTEEEFLKVMNERREGKAKDLP